MDTDLFFVVGVALAVLSLPTFLNAFAESRAPRTASIMVMIAGGLIVLAAMNHPGGYGIEDIPEAIRSVIQRYFR